MKRVTLLLLLMIILSAVCAQESFYQQQIDSIKVQLAYNPLDISQRLNLAYFYMMNNQPELALPEYQQVRKQDPESGDAAAGLLWALNSLNRWTDTISEADSILKGLADQNKETKGLILNHLATAEASLRKPLAARRDYSVALTLINSELRDLPHSGLVWIYQRLDNYPKAMQHYRQITAPFTDSQFKGQWQLETAIALKDSASTILSLGAAYKLRSLTYRIKAEEILISGSPFRWNLKGSLRKQLPYLDVRLGLQYLEGDDVRLYPGKAVNLTLSPGFYYGKLGIRARISQHLAVFERFNVYQSDLGLELKTHPVTLTASLSKVFQDNEALNSDTENWVVSASASSRIYRDIYLGAYAGWGDLAWHTSSNDDITDDFAPGKAYYGMSLSAPLWKQLNIIFYQQLGMNEDNFNHLSLLRLVYTF